MVRKRCWLGLAAVCVTLAPARAVHADDRVVHGEHLDLATDFSWGYRIGVKQPLGALRNGFNVHQISRADWPENVGNPNYLLWVDEFSGAYGISHDVGNQLPIHVVNPGGQAAIDGNGYIWLVTGGRASDMPFDLYRSISPYNPAVFECVLDDFVTHAASTTPCLAIEDDKLLLYWRHEGSSVAREVRAMVRRYDLNGEFQTFEMEQELGTGVYDRDLGRIGIEQLWSRYDPRHRVHMYTWQWFDVWTQRFGSNPFVYSDDAGETWKRANGAPLVDLPVDYSRIDPVLVPDDTLADGRTTDWLVRDLGVGPAGSVWMTIPGGSPDADGAWRLDFWRLEDGQWSPRPLTGPMLMGKAHACGATEGALVLAYAEQAEPNKIWARFSLDDGASWSSPRQVLEIPPTPQGEDVQVNWISFNQPADAYTDDAARFFFAYSRVADGMQGRRYQNSLGWLKATLEPPCPADLDADGVVGVLDFFLYLDLFIAGDPRADITGDGVIDVNDFIGYLDLFEQGCP